MPSEDTPRDASARTPGGEESGVGAGGEEIIGATLEGLRRAAEEVEHVATVAETLQRSLLPERLPELTGLAFDARYVAGGSRAQVGGDWYDAIALGDGGAAIAIGDVVGHGLAAATRMARLQNALRAYALEGLRPALVLERMNRFAREVSGGPMATLLYATVDVHRSRLRFASAGHPPPLVLPPGEAPFFAEGAAGVPLGVTSFPAYEESALALAPGATVLLYTDGLVERPGSPLEDGLEWLRGYASELGPGAQPLCEALLAGRFRGGEPRDDVALLAVRVDASPGERLELELRADQASLTAARRALRRWLEANGAGEAETYECLVACGEACSNAVAHAYALGDASYALSARRQGRVVELTVRDRGSWRSPRAGSAGRGLVLIEELMDEVEIERRADGTVIRMRRTLAGVGDRRAA